MTNITTTPLSFNFHGDSLVLINFNDQPYVAMRNLVESIGLAWQAQIVKIKSNPRWGVMEIMTPSKGGNQATLCMPLRKLHGWLMTLSPNKVKPELREKVIAYQNECDDALWDYWNNGIAVRTPYVANPDDVLTAAQAEELRLALKKACEKLPIDKQAAFMIKGWSKLKSHFGVTYRKIPQREFTEAVSLLTRYATEWELVDDSPKTEIAAQPTQPEVNFNENLSGKRWILSFANGIPQTVPCPDRAVIGTPMEIVALIRDRKNSPFDMMDVDDVAAACRSRKLGQQLAILEENEMLRKLLAKCGALAEH
ncbi:phage antirepressor N-terminal domain-containing protein [Undibacterium sp. MH2W]|uniref:phage antirepressor N-terminal domain-containing protein n=1 Tax=Undibacterium sp. MH2W TaxID=3413044 RepID=UPI003BF2EFFD